MIKYIEGTVFNSPAKTIVNAVNCFGVMGAGIALEFKLRYPEMYLDYESKCKSKQIEIGIPRIYEYSNNRWIMNFPTKSHWRYPSKLKWIEMGLEYFVRNYKRRNIESIAFPKLGTNKGGLDWDEVKPIMEKYLNNIDIPVYICLDEKNEAEGTEKEMLKIINELDLINQYRVIGITKNASEKIYSNGPFKRFWHISNIDGVTSKAYSKIFEYCYKQSSEYKYYNDNNTEQLKLI